MPRKVTKAQQKKNEKKKKDKQKKNAHKANQKTNQKGSNQKKNQSPTKNETENVNDVNNNNDNNNNLNNDKDVSHEEEEQKTVPLKDNDNNQENDKDIDRSLVIPKEKKRSDLEVKMFGDRSAYNNRKDGSEKNHDYKFWKKEPVIQFHENVDVGINQPIETKTINDVRKQPLLLPRSYEWVALDIMDENIIQELYTLLAEHYVEDDDNHFRFNYSKDFLRWALAVPGYRREWHLGVRHIKSRALCACITAIPAKISIYHRVQQMVEINFLCVHKELRSKRLAPVLIKEITRRVNVTDCWQAVYTAGVVLPKPIASNRYWHRSLNPKKLIEVEFSSMNKRLTMPRLIRLYKLPKETKTPNLRPLKESDCESACNLLKNYLKQFKLFVNFTLDEFKHCFLNRNGVIYSFVVPHKKNENEVTDFISFYELPSSVLNHPKHNNLKAAYSYYNVITSVPWKDLMNDALILANNLKFDVFNALDVMENETFLKELKFKIGCGNLRYYVYNWRCPTMKASDVALVLL